MAARLLSAILIAAAIVGCTSIDHSPAGPMATPARTESRTLVEPVRLVVAGARVVEVESGTVFDVVGEITEGEVLAPRGRGLVLTGPHSYEAYLVVADGRATGFYLPVENAFTPVRDGVSVRFRSTSTGGNS